LIFKQIFIFKPDFGPVVVFLDCPLHRGHRTSFECDAQMIRTRPGRSESEYWTRIRTLNSFILMRQCKIKMRMRTVRYGMRTRMQMPGP
jgi:hypothetical protein